MGCDIHAFVEYSPFGSSEDPYWQCIMSNVGNRDYQFFSLIADCGRGEFEPVFQNRGLPEGNLSYVVDGEMWLTISNKWADEPGYCSEESAKSWGEEIKVVGETRKVMHPDLHSHTWLTCDELAQVIGAYMTRASDHPYGVEWDAALAAMRALEERGYRSRMIIAFDN